MSYDLYVHIPGDMKLSAELLTKNMEVLRWQIRLLNDDDVVITDLDEAATVIAWDITYEPAPAFAARYIPGVRVNFFSLPDDEVDFIGGCGIALRRTPLSDVDTDELRQAYGEDDNARFFALFAAETICTFTFHTGGSAHPYRFLLQDDLVLNCKS